MAEKKHFKTKLCVLYQRGHCEREFCTFAHGDSELRRFQGYFTDRRIYGDNDLRSKLDRKHSPLRRRSFGRDSKNSYAYERVSPSQPSQTRKLRTHEQMNNANDSSGGFKSPDETTDSMKDEKQVVSNSSKVFKDEAKQVQCDVNVLLNKKSHLEIELEEKVQEAGSLSSRVSDLEAQLSQEKDKYKRVNSMIKKLIRAHVHHSRLQDDMKRSQVRLDQLLGELRNDAVPIAANEDKLNVDIIMDEDSLESEGLAFARKTLQNSMEVSQRSKPEYLTTLHVAGVMSPKRNSLVHVDGHQEAEIGNKRKDIARSSDERKPKRRNRTSKNFGSLDKAKSSDTTLAMPPTCMAAHASDDFNEQVEPEEDHPEMEESPKNITNDLPLPPPPPLLSGSQNNYRQYKDDDENIDTDELEEFEEVDIV
ncbi:zinc finger CCCH domain-containing protein 13 isoform X2 [Amaranthus tricolor]|uniref:zinc finger CCCH domain-containing protein 13 isoform X2 n=1 Tax=Amaranthus tricolor TaxID=29722 RepID=UPI0025882452|nr:zinc finger CCCH domain-containing protein 13 isoform X2 [Amaranthus tricolor]